MQSERVRGRSVNLPAGYYSWSRDGKSVYFDVFSVNDPAIYRAKVPDVKVPDIGATAARVLRKADGAETPRSILSIVSYTTLLNSWRCSSVIVVKIKLRSAPSNLKGGHPISLRFCVSHRQGLPTASFDGSPNRDRSRRSWSVDVFGITQECA